METNTQALAKEISDSSSLNPAQRSALLKHLPNLNADQLTQLSALFASEPKPVVVNPIARAAASGNTEFFQQLDTLIAVESRNIRKAEEDAQRGEEETATDRMFDDTSTSNNAAL